MELVISYGIHVFSIYTTFMSKSNGKKKIIYLDNASATPIDARVLEIIAKVSSVHFANTGAIHELGVQNKKILEDARERVAEILKAQKREIIFTSGATESNNLGVLGVICAMQASDFFGLRVARALSSKESGLNQTLKNRLLAPHIITTNIEHASVLEVCKHLEKTKRAEVSYIPVEPNGIVDPQKIKKAIKKNTVLVSVMYANNEIGTIQPIREIAKEIRQYRKGKSGNLEYGYFSAEKFLVLEPSLSQASKLPLLPFFHTDATQAMNYLPIDVQKLGVDLMSFNGAKIYGPKGVGALYIKKGTPMGKIMYGGEQEFGMRSGTENLPAIVGLAEALQITESMKESETKRLTKLRDYFLHLLEHSLILQNYRIVLNGDKEDRLPNNVNITIAKIPSDLLVLELSARGIYISEKSACKSGDKKPSHVIGALRKENLTSLRFSLGRDTEKRDIDHTVKVMESILSKLRKWYY